MNTRAWLHLNPTRHKVTLTAEPNGIVRACFHGGEGIDQRFSGTGAQVDQACENALEAREAIKSALP